MRSKLRLDSGLSDSEAFVEAVVWYQKNGPWSDGREKTVVAFHAERMLGRLEEPAIGAEWIRQTEAPDSDAGDTLEL